MALNAIDTLHSAVAVSTSTTGATTLPTGWLADDVAYAVLQHFHTSTVTVSPPAGWTEVVAVQPDADRNGVFVFRRVLQGGDGNPTWTVDNQTAGWSHQIFVVRGADTVTPEAAAATTTDTASGTSHTGAAVNAVSDGALAVSVFAARANTTVALGTANGFHLRSAMRLQTATGNDGSGHVGFRPHETAGNTGVPVWQTGASVLGRIVQFAVASADYTAGDPFIVGWTPLLASGAATQQPGLPAGWEADDLAVAVGLHRNTAQPTLGISAGWNEIESDNTNGRLALYLWKRQLQGGDSGPTITPSTVSDGYGSLVLALRNVTAVEDVAASVELNNAWTTVTPTAVETVTDGAVVLFATGTGDDNTLSFDATQGFAGLIGTEFDTTIGGDFAIAVGVKAVSPAGSQTLPTLRQNASAGDNSTTIKTALRAVVPDPDPDPEPATGGNRIGGTGAIRRSPVRR